MSNIHAHARAREAGQAWLERERPMSVAALPKRRLDDQLEAFVAGWVMATAPESEAEVNEIVVSLVRDAFEAAGDSAPEEAAAIEAAQRIVAYLGAIHREEQDQWAVERATGQRQLDDATALMTETAELLRGYEAHHRARAIPGPENGPYGAPAALEKAERNALAAARLEAWLRGEDRYPTNPAEALRDIAEGMVDGETIKGVDHASFDRAAAACNEIVVSHVPPEEDRSPRSAPWRQEGVADLAAFRITTGDPRFEPSAPVTVNGFLYVPAKEKEHG